MELLIRYIRILEQLNKEQLRQLNLLQKELDVQIFISNCYFFAIVVLVLFYLVLVFFDEFFEFFDRFKN